MIYSVGIYARISVEHAEEPSDSIANQTELIMSYIKKLGGQYRVYGVYTDRGVSGTTFERAGFLRLLDDVSQGKVNCIMVKDLSRLGRNYIETGNYLEKLFPDLGVRFIAVADGYDTEASGFENDNLSMNIKNLVNELYARDISQKVRAVKYMTKKNGGYAGGRPPYGYICSVTAGVRRLEVDEAVSPVIKKIYECRAAGMTYSQIAAVLYKNGIHTPSDYTRLGRIFREEGDSVSFWNFTALSKILKNPEYAKDFKIENKTALKASAGEAKKAAEETSVRAGTQTAAAESAESEEKTAAIFGGIIFCGDCKKKMHTVYYKNKKTGGKVYGYYCGSFSPDGKTRCRNYIRQENLCRCMKGVFASLQENRIISAVSAELLNSEAADCELQSLEKQSREARSRIKRAEGQIFEAYRRYREKSLSGSAYKRIKEQGLKRRALLQKNIERIEMEKEQISAREKEREKIIDSLKTSAGAAWVAGNEKNGTAYPYTSDFARAFFDRIMVYGGKRVRFCCRLSEKKLQSGTK